MPRKVCIRLTLDDETLHIPYEAESYTEGTIHPYRPLVQAPEQIALIPELEGQPALRKLLEAINAPGGMFESVRIDTSYHDYDGQLAHVVAVGMIFRDRTWFQNFDRCLIFAGRLLETLHDNELFCANEDVAQLELQRTVLREEGIQGWIMDLFLMGQGQDRQACDADLASRCRALHGLLHHPWFTETIFEAKP
ncbi:hypothetical protein MHM84_00960 [Halomonas sp. McH1-25]|uniref:hypothetical protein n=1 Tax=unclassified Halomonas TaxID=2609666 RepID=UPI001EF6271C|nr:MULTISPECIES: hypothetical protein [unclassified Halomonas]MCG7598351.1 hypothetical protein [Halomonas sp. McH1-25]MCP1342707.1 hypothetical protein [Halomonas sp. FL8]MCP1362178.1 hypothetical protein [Halomonas sp. BBD45]MCP1364232.1 hypothetical protein [Halomonas sp. BBD48]